MCIRDRSRTVHDTSVLEALGPCSFYFTYLRRHRWLDGGRADSLRHIRFRFLSENQRLLSINSRSGVITTGDVIDRDSSSLCRQRESCQINVDVVLQPVQFFQVSRCPLLEMCRWSNFPLLFFSARCNIYIWRLCYDVDVRLSVCLCRKCIVVTVNAGSK